MLWNFNQEVSDHLLGWASHSFALQCGNTWTIDLVFPNCISNCDWAVEDHVAGDHSLDILWQGMTNFDINIPGQSRLFKLALTVALLVLFHHLEKGDFRISEFVVVQSIRMHLEMDSFSIWFVDGKPLIPIAVLPLCFLEIFFKDRMFVMAHSSNHTLRLPLSPALELLVSLPPFSMTVI